MTEQKVIRLKNRLWTEEFRPIRLEDVIGHEEIIIRLQAFVKAENSLEFLFSGPPASGKTTTAIAFARDLFGDDWERNFTELNASDERGIDVVRNKIKDFAGTAPVNAPFKIIFLDEVDELTKPAQSALRRTIEKYSNTCRFVLSCNYDNKLIAPIKSRLMSFHFAGLKDDDMKTLAYRVIKAENLTMPDEAVDLLVELSDRDTRVVLNTLQVCALLGNDITLETVKNTLQVPDKKQVKQMIDSAITGDLDLAFEIGGNHIINSGFDVGKILRMIDKNLTSLDVHNNTKCALLNIISDTEDRINHGGTPDIQLRALLSKFALVTSVPPECPAIQAQ